MSEQAGMPGELIFEQTAQIIRVTEYSVALDALVSGEIQFKAYAV